MTDTVILELTWAVTWDNVPSDMCAKRRLKPDCASMQPYESSLLAWRNFAFLAYPHCAQRWYWSVCAGWSGPWLGEHLQGTIADIIYIISASFLDPVQPKRFFVRCYAPSPNLYTYIYIVNPPRYNDSICSQRWICSCNESLMVRMICKKDLVLFLFPNRTYILDIC